MTDPDHQIVEKVLAGNTGAFRMLVEKYQQPVINYLYRMIPNESDRQEICQDVFLKAFRHLNQFRFDAKFSTWLFSIAYRRAIEVLRRKHVDTEDIAEHDAPDTADLEANYASEATARLVAEAIKGLKPEEQTIISLFHLQEMGIREVSEIIGKPEGTVKSDLFRIRKKLKDQLQAQLQATDQPLQVGQL